MDATPLSHRGFRLGARRARSVSCLLAAATLVAASHAVLVMDAGASLDALDASALPRRPSGSIISKMTRIFPPAGLYRALIPEARDPRVFPWPDPLPHLADPRSPRRALWHSQIGQDKLAAEVAEFRPGGVFVDVGASDGVTLSNTLALERDFGWRGVCLEADPTTAAVLRLNRPGCTVVEAAVTNSALAGTPLPFLSVLARDAIVYLDEGSSGSGEGATTNRSAAAAANAAARVAFAPGTGMLSGLAHRVTPDHLARMLDESLPPGAAPHVTGSTVPAPPHWQVVDVPTTSLAALLATHGLTTVDFMSLDIEGGEADALESVAASLADGSLVINVLALEENDPRQPEAANLLRASGRYEERRIAHDIIFVRQPLAWSWER